MKISKIYTRFAFLLVFLLGGGMVVLGVRAGVERAQFNRIAKTTKGRISSINSHREPEWWRNGYDSRTKQGGGIVREVYIAYTVNGQQYESRANYSHSSMREGQMVEVRYDPAKPDVIRNDSKPTLAIFLCGFGAFTWLLLAIALQVTGEGRGLGKWMRKNSRRCGYVLALILGVWLIVLGAGEAMEQAQFNRMAKTTRGQISRIEEQNGARGDRVDGEIEQKIYITYSVDGRAYESSIDDLQSGMQQGQTVPILYDPANPEDIRMESKPTNAWLLCGLGAFVLALLAVVWLRTGEARMVIAWVATRFQRVRMAMQSTYDQHRRG